MSLPSRKERRYKKKGTTNYYIKNGLLIIINIFLGGLKNYSLLLFIAPLSIAYISYIGLKKKKRLLIINIFLLVMVYIFYLEFTFRLWAEN